MRRSRIVPGLVLLVLISSLVTHSLVGPPAVASPPQSNAFGKSLGEWLFLYWDWYFKTSQYFGNDPTAAPDHVGHVQFLSLDMDEFGTPYERNGITFLPASKNVTMDSGSPFVLPVLTFNGENYLNGIPIVADPKAAWPLSSITTGSALVTIDSKTIMNSAVDNLSDFAAGPFDFNPPIAYGTDPQFRYPVWLTTTTAATDPGYAIAAIWAEGIGFINGPLSVGTHTLHVLSAFNDPRFPIGYDNTWTITVVPKGKG